MQHSVPQMIKQLGTIPDKIREGRERLAIKLLIMAYKQICEEKLYPLKEHEEWFSAVLKAYIENLCPEYSTQTGHQWDVVREYPNDNEQIRTGQSNPRGAPRIDIVITYWHGLGEKKCMFPFECKLLIEKDVDLIKSYISKGLIDRYLTVKDYSAKGSWGGMIGYILQGTHITVVSKLNEQIKLLLNRPTEYLQQEEPIADFEAIYKSQHQRLNRTNSLTITHIFLAFPQTRNSSENLSTNPF